MGIFKDILSDSESLFLDSLALDLDFVPHIIKYRESQQHYIANCIKPLFSERSGRNLFVFGAPGIGKTVAIKHLFNELHNESDDIETIYINCWKKDSGFKIVKDICGQIGYKWIHNKSSDELLKEITKILNKKSVVFCFDEVDKLKETEIIYSIAEDVLRKVIIFVTNEKDWYNKLDNRIKSRLNVDHLEFKPYNFKEVEGILNQRVNYAFSPGVFDKEAFNVVTNKCYNDSDVRVGIFLLKESGEIAEDKSSKVIKLEHVNEALSRGDKFSIKDPGQLDEEVRNILDIIKGNSGRTAMELYQMYKDFGGDKSYRTFQRKIDDLRKKRLVETDEINEGEKGRSTVVSYNKKITEF